MPGFSLGRGLYCSAIPRHHTLKWHAVSRGKECAIRKKEESGTKVFANGELACDCLSSGTFCFGNLQCDHQVKQKIDKQILQPERSTTQNMFEKNSVLEKKESKME